ncbi:MAG: TolC family protein [Micavibrio sp.]|nr:TolC family protein [Micavibrio sp.]
MSKHKIVSLARTITLTASLALSACAVGPDYHKPAITAAAAWSQQPGAVLAAGERNVRSSWWTSFHDEKLNKIVQKALAQNFDLKIAQARILEARALKLNASSTLYPEINASGSAERGNPGLLTQNKALDLYQGGFDASYELDLFGGNRRKVEASSAMVGSREASYQDLSITLVAEVVNEYATLRELQTRYGITKQMAETQKRLADFNTAKFSNGAASDLEVQQSNALYQTTAANLPALAREATAAIYRISVLTGTENDEVVTLLSVTENVPAADHAPIMDAPAAVLARRPDIAEAERNLAANTALKGAAISEMYPKISLSALFGWQNTSLLPSATIWSLASGFAMPILNFGRIQGDIKAADARQQQAFQAYKKTVIAAVAEVETKLSDYARNREHTISLKAALDSNNKALQMSHLRFDRGLTPLIDVLDAENKTFAARNAYITALADEARSVAALEKSGGF